MGEASDDKTIAAQEASGDVKLTMGGTIAIGYSTTRQQQLRLHSTTIRLEVKS